MNRFKVGERIVVYDRANKYKGTIVSNWQDCLGVELKDAHMDIITVHYKQCRKLKPKAKTCRRFKGEWKRMYPYGKSSNQQMAFVPYEPFVDLAFLEGRECDLITVKGTV